MGAAISPGGPLKQGVKRLAEQILWSRIALQKRWERMSGFTRALPTEVLPTDLLSSTADYERAVAECRRLRLPLHHDRPKNWDALGAVGTIISQLGTNIAVLDAGAARYSSILPWLCLYDVRHLVGNNLEFSTVVRHGAVRFEPGDITNMHYQDASFDAVTCMSVIEHGVDLSAFLAEAARITRPGGVLVVSTDYDQDPPDTTGMFAYGAPVKIFGPGDIAAFVDQAQTHGFKLLGDLRTEHSGHPLYWKRTGLNFTFIRLTFTKTN